MPVFVKQCTSWCQNTAVGVQLVHAMVWLEWLLKILHQAGALVTQQVPMYFGPASCIPVH